MANTGQDAHHTTVIRSLDSRFLADPLDHGKVHLSFAPSPHFPIDPPDNQSMPNHTLAPLPVCHDLFLQNVTFHPCIHLLSLLEGTNSIPRGSDDRQMTSLPSSLYASLTLINPPGIYHKDNGNRFQTSIAMTRCAPGW